MDLENLGRELWCLMGQLQYQGQSLKSSNKPFSCLCNNVSMKKES